MDIKKILTPIDFKSTSGMMLRGKNIYMGASHTPNPSGINTKRAAKNMIRMRKKNAHSRN